jgi:hypothetical protein
MKLKATYLYCLVQSPRRLALGRVPRGLPGMGRVRALDAGQGLWLIASDAPLARYGREALKAGLTDIAWVTRCAVAHETVVSRFARAQALVPMKLFTLFLDDGRALEHVRKERKRLQGVVERVAGCLEWELRLTMDEGKAMASALRRGSPPARNAGEARSGAAFLLGKKRAQDAVHEVALAARASGDALFRDLSRHAEEARRAPGAAVAGARQRLLLDAHFLVAGKRAALFRAAARRSANDLSAVGYRLTLSGPWPPYHFVAEGT